MAQSCPVADYASALARELRFDPALARRVRAEVEDHLWEASGDDPSPETQQGAIAKFGPPRALARQYVAAALLVQMRRIGARAMLAIAVVFIAMEARLVWYAHMRWAPNQDWPSVSAFALALDRYAFLLSLGGALVGCGYIATRRIPARFDPGYGRELHRCMTMCGIATAALFVVVTVETLLTGIRLSGLEWHPAALVPALSMLAEITAAGLLIGQIREAARRSAAAALLL